MNAGFVRKFIEVETLGKKLVSTVQEEYSDNTTKSGVTVVQQ